MRAGGSIRRVRASELNQWWSVVSAVSNAAMRPFFRVHSRETERAGEGAGDHRLQSRQRHRRTGRRHRRRQEEATRTRFLVAAEVFRQRLPEWILRSFDQIPIRRGQGDVNALEEAIHTVKAGAIAALARRAGSTRTEPPRCCASIAAWLGWRWRREPRSSPSASGERRRGGREADVDTGSRGVHGSRSCSERSWPADGDPSDAEDLASFTQLVREAIEVQVARARATRKPDENTRRAGPQGRPFSDPIRRGR